MVQIVFDILKCRLLKFSPGVPCVNIYIAPYHFFFKFTSNLSETQTISVLTVDV